MAAANTSRAQAAAPPPADVRLLDATAAVLAFAAVALMLAVAVIWLSRQPLFAIRSIAIEGDVGHNSAATIRANATPRLAGNFLTMDLGTVRRAFESVPWVRHAVVKRIWPNRLRVQLEEHRPVALWGGETGSEKLVNSYGEVFEANLGDVEDDSLPTLAGPEGSSQHVLAMLAKLEGVVGPLGARIDTLTLSGRGSWQATLDSGAVVEMGRGSDEEVLARSARFVATLGQVTSRFQRPLAYADLRHNDGYAVRLRGVSTTSDAAPSRPASKKK